VKESTKQREAYFLDFAEKARKVCTTALAVTGGFRSADGMAQAISSGAVDFVGLARLLAIETDAPNKIISGKTFLAVKPIIWHGGQNGINGNCLVQCAAETHW
jgi:2,4-dienoyl-CoA reductase-like NADH-dependent reductase (Old Yellow Enzyme family)